MNKNRHIIGELQEFFANNNSSKAINSISSIMNSIRIQSKVIIDDTDLPNTGFKTEKVGKVFSHTQMKPILGFKALRMPPDRNDKDGQDKV